jgi:hypothetical protein
MPQERQLGNPAKNRLSFTGRFKRDLMMNVIAERLPGE